MYVVLAFLSTIIMEKEKCDEKCDVGGGNSKTDTNMVIEFKEGNTMEDIIKTKQVPLVVIDKSDHEGGGGGGKTDNEEAIETKEGNQKEDIKIEQVQFVLVDESDHEATAYDGGGGNIGCGGGGNIGCGGGGFGGESSSSSLLTPTPKMRGVREIGPPPFLKKIYEMVENPQTNSIISWSLNGDSFIIWDPFKLCTEVFPKYFRHANLSSFIYQLNNYGFRKISWEQSEYAHQYFQAKQKHLLKNIKRRHQQLISSKTVSSHDLSEKLASKVELIKLRKEHNKLEQLVKKLEQKQKNMDKNLTAFKTHIESCVTKQQDMLNLLANTFTPSFLLELKEKRELNKNDRDDEEASKRQKLSVVESTEISVEPIQVQENHMKDTNEDPSNSEKYTILWEIEDEGKDEEMRNEESKKIVMDLEDLIGQAADWGYIKELMEEAGCSSNPHGF